jgi:hypothetical protein
MPKINSTRLVDPSDGEFIRDALRLIEQRPAAVVALLIELGAEYLLRFVIEQKLARYLEALGALGPEVLDAVGANQLPSPRGRRRRPRRDRITATDRKKRASSKPWVPVPIKLSERRPGR